MNPTLRNLLVVVGVFVGGAGAIYTVYAPKTGVTQAELVDAGVLVDCVRRDRVCQVQLEDGGYAAKRLDFAVCNSVLPDGGTLREAVIPRKYADKIGDLEAWCKPTSGTSTLPAGGESDEPFDCACAKDSTCRNTSDGGVAPTGVTLSPGTWTGAGCQPKACVELYGVSSWPAGCPQ
jgi:hypothetical protein